jgi:hypothetical protein
MRKVFNPARNEASEVELKYFDLLYACIHDKRKVFSISGSDLISVNNESIVLTDDSNR